MASARFCGRTPTFGHRHEETIINTKGTNGQSGANAAGWAKSKDKFGIVGTEQKRWHWAFR